MNINTNEENTIKEEEGFVKNVISPFVILLYWTL